ncbi:uncharacterized protein LOC127253772 isoform X2 [Andrographis paniculata]|uniref:uncharacterized protein LOC127253772 isoform X2 n=1 Tax=Andrographis paniculata TaxID=175694 RepID=UPI0021E93C4F|nr:uncharacterized protein LOC127253772 isoform X2 [Andrographis paniculata]
MVDADDRLDFEFEDPIPVAPPITKRKKKVIDLDDLLEAHKKEQKKINEKISKQRKIRKVYDMEDEADDAAEARLSECVDKCQKEINQINGDEELRLWGIRVFGENENLPQQDYPELKTSHLLQSLTNQKISSLVELNIEEGETFLDGLLVDGWLLHLVYTSGCVEKIIATWTFNLMLYSPKVLLMEAACEFWCAILSRTNKDDLSSIRIEWLPRYSDLKTALLSYGYLLDSPAKVSTDIDMIQSGPPQNIRSWMKCAASCCQIRNHTRLFSVREAEELLAVFISFVLDRQLLGLSIVMHEAMLSVIRFFRDEEWLDSCKKVSKSLAYRLPCDINCLRVVESITGTEGRCKQLRSALAFQFLLTCLNKKVCDPEEILQMLISINVKDKTCDLFKIYIYLNLVENWLSFDETLKDKSVLHELWGVCLRNFSCGVTITDLRPYASNVRSKASYLLQGSMRK